MLFFVFLALPARAEKMLIAVIDLEAKGVSKIVSGAVTDIIRSEMVKTGLFTVVERTQMAEILKEQGFQMTGCTDESCAVKMGKLLSAQKILVGEINRVGEALMITVRIVDVEKGTSDHSASQKSLTEDEVDVAAVELTKNLATSIVEGNAEYFVQKKTYTGYYARALYPGWGQLYADRDFKGFTYLGTFTLAAGFAVYSWMNYSSAAKAYDNVPRNAEQSEFDKKFKAKKDAAIMFIAAGGLTGAIYIMNWIDIVFFSKPEAWGKQAANDIRGWSGFNIGYAFNPLYGKTLNVGYGIYF